MISFTPDRLRTFGIHQRIALYLCVALTGLVPLVTFFESNLETGFNMILESQENCRLSGGLKLLNFLLLTIYITLICTAAARIECRNNKTAWFQGRLKQRQRDFFMTFAAMHLLIFSTFLLYVFFITAAPDTERLFKFGSVFINHQKDEHSLLAIAVQSYLVLFVASTIQLDLGMRFRSLLLPAGLAVALSIATVMLLFAMHCNESALFPFSHSFMNPIPSPNIFNVMHTEVLESGSFGYGVLLLSLFLLSDAES